jgi:glucose-6-phosphate isomerase
VTDFSIEPGDLASSLDIVFSQLDQDRFVEALWARRADIWSREYAVKTAIAQRLGWLGAVEFVGTQIPRVETFAQRVRSGAFTDIVLFGMGGSSLAPEVLRRTFRVQSFHVLDTTHPAAIRRVKESIDLERTLFVSASKSGGTLETRSHTDFFWELTGGRGAAFVAITDPGSDLERAARERGFRHVFPGEPTIGGRYSALSPFGMVPAALMGIDVERLLGNAGLMADACRRDDGNPGYELGRAFGIGWQEGRDKICIAETEGSFGLWAEQLIAESTGKQGKGLIPAPGESPDGSDRQAAEPQVADPYALGGEFFRWEFAVAVAGSYLGINPFDQPDVQAAKDKTNEVLATGKEPSVEPEGSLDALLAEANEGDYVCVQAFIEPSDENDRRIGDLVATLRERSGLVVTHGYGPRYLHSTGQLHKGGPNTGLFVQVVDDPGDELAIPGKPFGFRRLLRAQAAGDYASLKERGRRAVRIRLEET